MRQKKQKKSANCIYFYRRSSISCWTFIPRNTFEYMSRNKFCANIGFKHMCTFLLSPESRFIISSNIYTFTSIPTVSKQTIGTNSKFPTVYFATK